MSVSPYGDPVILSRMRLRTAAASFAHRRPNRSPPDFGWSNQRVLNPVAHHKLKSHRGGGFLIWWRRRESNPRPQVLYRQSYMLSQVI